MKLRVTLKGLRFLKMYENSENALAFMFEQVIVLLTPECQHEQSLLDFFAYQFPILNAAGAHTRMCFDHMIENWTEIRDAMIRDGYIDYNDEEQEDPELEKALKPYREARRRQEDTSSE